MMTERRFFKWNDEDNITPVKLGDSIDVLLEQNIIVHSKGEGDKDFRLSTNEDIWIGAKNGLVNYVYFTRNSGDEQLGFDLFTFEYPATEPITNYLSNTYEQLLFEDIYEVKKNFDGDILFLIFRDFIPSNIFLIRHENI